MSEHSYYMSTVPGIERCMHVERTTPPEWVRVYMRKRAQRRAKRNTDPRSALLKKIKLEELRAKIEKMYGTY